MRRTMIWHVAVAFAAIATLALGGPAAAQQKKFITIASAQPGGSWYNTVNPELAAHFFAFHFATIAAITPPVALAAYAAASLSGADPFKTGFTACRIGLIAFIAAATQGYLFRYFQMWAR